MILFIGPLADSAAAHLTLLMIARDAEFVVLDPRNFGTEWDLAWWLSDGEMQGYVRVGPDRRIDLSEVQAVWAHMIALPDRQDEPGHGADVSQNDLLAGLSGFADCFPGMVISRPASAASNTVKPFQSALIAKHGFEPIRTLITTCPDAARAFCDELNGEAIFKSISWRRSIVRRVNEDDLNRMEHVRNCPTQFQEFVVGTDIRVHVAQDRVFATEIGCSTDDYRYVPADGERVMRGIELPPEVAARCVTLAESLGMTIAGVDLRRSPDGLYHCFEVNPSPGFMFYEQFTGQRIGDAFIDLVCEDAAPIGGASL